MSKKEVKNIELSRKIQSTAYPFDQQQFWHLSQGSPFVPYSWMYNLTNSKTPKLDGTFGPLLEGLDQKHNLIPDKKSKYLIDWVGLAATWTGTQGKGLDILKKDELAARDLRFDDENQPQVAMVESNCALCHTSQLNINDKLILFEGGPSLIDTYGYFRDIAGSIGVVLLDAKELTKFLMKYNYTIDKAKQTACEFTTGFKKEIKFTKLSFRKRKLSTCMININLNATDRKKRFKAFDKLVKTILTKDTQKKMRVNNRKVLNDYLQKLFKMTIYKKYPNLEINFEIKSILDRMSKVISVFPYVKSPAGGSWAGRTDAFGRIANSTLRSDDPVNYYATVSYPPIWGTKYKSSYHYNGNINSLLMRDIGQSFGLGAVFTEPNSYRSTTHFKNIFKLESMANEIKVPQWSKIVGIDHVDTSKIIDGCNLYVAECLSCHSASAKVGPENKLLKYNIFKLNHPGLRTDPNHAVLQAQPYRGKYLKDTLMNLVTKVRDQYKRDNPGELNANGDLAEQAADLKLRGKEEFRDPYVGNRNVQNDYLKLDDVKGSNKGYAYQARHLSGVWATPPYLHNGSVSSIEQLFTKPNKRLKKFLVHHGEYDIKELGLKQPSLNKVFKHCKSNIQDCFSAGNPNAAKSFLLKYDKFEKGKGPQPDYRDIIGKGNSNMGHYFDSWDKWTNNDKQSLLEFLKVLEPEDEYMWNERDHLYKIVGASCQPGKNLK